jgi:hypothetical protein
LVRRHSINSNSLNTVHYLLILSSHPAAYTSPVHTLALSDSRSMSPAALPRTASGKAGPSKAAPTPDLGLSISAHQHIKSHFMDLSETHEHCGEDGTRTPRPGNLTPSPPRSRANSRKARKDVAGGGGKEAAGGISPEEKNGNGKRNLDGKGRLWEEEEGEVARLMRTVDFAARVSLDRQLSRRRRRELTR